MTTKHRHKQERKSFKKLYVGLITIIISSLIFLSFDTYGHELVHKNIFNDFNCDSKINMLSPATEPINCSLSWEDNRWNDLSHNINDSVNYNLTFIQVFMVINSCFLWVLIWK